MLMACCCWVRSFLCIAMGSRMGVGLSEPEMEDGEAGEASLFCWCMGGGAKRLGGRTGLPSKPAKPASLGGKSAGRLGRRWGKCIEAEKGVKNC